MTATDNSYTDDKQIILVVDDTPENINVLSGTLRSDYKVKAALNGEKALKLAFSEPHPDLILLDIMMPGMDGYEVCQALKSNPSTQKIPVIFITAKSEVEDEQKGLEMGAVDYITKPISPPLVKARIKTHLALSNQNRALEEKVTERTAQLQQSRLDIIKRLGRAAEFKDNETGMHVTRMSHYSRLMAEAISDDSKWIEQIFNAAPMHDIGKIGIPDNILLKPGKLDDQEWDMMRKHPEFGANIIGEHSSELMQMAKEIAISHHEKWNGLGYPNKLKGEDIPLSGRIVAIADVFDALTAERPYKKAWLVDDAVNLINEESGQHFDPELVEIFNKVLPKILEVKAQYAEAKTSSPDA